MTQARRGHVALFVGLVAVSTSGPFFVMCGIHAFAAVFWRTLLAGLVGLGIALLRGTFALRDVRSHRKSIVVAGALLGAHLLLWVKAFEMTDYASNLLLLVSQPLFGAVLAARAGQPISRHAFAALALAAAGMLLIAGGDFRMGPRAIFGDAVSVTAGAVIAFFYVAGRPARMTLPLEVFMGSVMLVAATVALPVALVAGVRLSGYGAASWAWLGAIVLVTTLVGHGLLNLAARYVPIFSVNLVIVLEPVVAIAIGSILFGARITPLQCVGGTFLGGAVILGLRAGGVPAGRAVLRS